MIHSTKNLSKTSSELFDDYLNKRLNRQEKQKLEETLRQDGELRILFRIYKDLELALNRSDELEIRNIFNNRRKQKTE